MLELKTGMNISRRSAAEPPVSLPILAISVLSPILKSGGFYVREYSSNGGKDVNAC